MFFWFGMLFRFQISDVSSQILDFIKNKTRGKTCRVVLYLGLSDCPESWNFGEYSIGWRE
jgi:hypothetical protein